MAVPQSAVAGGGDPPSRAARISYLRGSVSMQPAEASDWTEAVVNRPMTIGDKLWTDTSARAELHAGAAAIHLGERTGFSFLNLDDYTIQIRLTEGSVNMRVRELRSGETYEIDTPNLAFTVTHAGDFRIDVDENGAFTNITAFRGEGEVVTGGRTYRIHAGSRANFIGLENPRYETGSAHDPDDLDRWAMDRDARADRSVSARYVSRDVTGYEDLDDHGVWREVREYGPVWYPTVSVGWVPYRYGHWVWIDPWGWTWVEDEPWGYAPFHYGRWVFVGGYWGWCPGPFIARPIFAPALVGFVGGRHFFFGVGFGEPVGWFPLGFGEPFFPAFHCSRVFITNINITNTVINNTTILNTTNFNGVQFVNQHIGGAVTAVPRSAFVNSQPVANAALRVSARDLDSAEVTSAAAVTPTQRSVLGARGAVNEHLPPQEVLNRRVVARSTPAPAPVPFSAGQSALARNPGHPLDAQTMDELRAKFGNEAPAIRSEGSARMGGGSPAGRSADGATGGSGSVNTRAGQSSAPLSDRQGERQQGRPPSAARGPITVPQGPAARSNESEAPAVNPGANSHEGNGTLPSRRAIELQQDKPRSSSPRATSQQGSGSDRSFGGAGQSPTVTNDSPGMHSRSSDSPPDATVRSDRPATSAPRETTRPSDVNRSAPPTPRNESNDSPGMRSHSSDSPPNATVRSDRPATSAPRETTRPPDVNRSSPPPPRTSNHSEDRPQANWNGGGSTGRQSGQAYSSPSYSERSYSPPPQSYSPPPRSNSEPSRSYSAPSGNYSAPSRSYPAPSPSNSGGGRSSSGSSGRSSSEGSGSRGSSGSSEGSSGRSGSGSPRDHN